MGARVAHGRHAAPRATLQCGVLPQRVRDALLNLLLLGVSLAFVLALCELVFARVNRAQGGRAAHPHGEMALFTRYDPILGWDGVAGVRATLLGKTVSHNARGERGPDVDLVRRPGTRRAVVLGDSQAWGLGVADDETIAARLQLRLGRGGEPWQAINLGVSGYGTDQAYLKYLLHGARYEPDVVAWIVFKNDLAENVSTHVWGVDKPRFFFDGERLCLGNLPPPKAPGWPEDGLTAGAALDLSWSETWRFVRTRRFRLEQPARPAAEALARLRKDVPCLENRAAYVGDGARLMLVLLRRLDALVSTRGARLRVVFVPRPLECRKPRRATYYAALQSEAESAGLVTIDLRRRAATAGLEAEALFLKGDAHLSAAGNDLVAQALAASLR